MNDNLYLRDPQETELGRRIIQESIKIIDELGFEKFTFKKLAEQIGSTEASVYRYFDNKHRLLVYVIAWYWSWLEYRIDFGTQNIKFPLRKLEVALDILTQKKETDPTFPLVDEAALFRIVIAESDKTYLTKQVDEDNKEGLFRGFKSLCAKIAGFVKEANPEFEFPHSLISTALQASHQQLFYSDHLPSLTELGKTEEDVHVLNGRFLKEMVLKSITK